MIPFPINADAINQVFGISIGVDEVHAFLASQVAASTFGNPPKNFRDAVVLSADVAPRYEEILEEMERPLIAGYFSVSAGPVTLQVAPPVMASNWA